MEEAYSSLAEWYEYLGNDCDYDSWSQSLYDQLRALGIRDGTGLDIGCGSGAFTRRFAARGFRMTGFDVSEAMLTEAERLSRGDAARPLYVACDARRIRVREKADFALCVNDCLNYLPQKDVPAFFRRVCGCLRPGGAFLADVSSPYKLREVIGSNTFCEDRDDIAYLWFNRAEEDRVTMELTVFVRGADGRFGRREERHVQYIHGKESLLAAAADAGFEIVSGAEPEEERAERLRFVFRRPGGAR